MRTLTKFFIIGSLLALTSCEQQFLDIKRDANQVVPSTIADYQALLDYQGVMNEWPSVELNNIGSDEYYVYDEHLNALSQRYQRNAYLRNAEIFEGGESNDWNHGYQHILYANMALDVEEVQPTAQEQAAWNNVKGSALFFRALNHYQLAQTFCKPFIPISASADAGIPLRLDYDVTSPASRNTVSEVYNSIIADLMEAIELLPVETPSKFRPNKPAACLLLARTYLQMENYEEAHRYSDLGLQHYGQLIDFNELDLSARYTFPGDHGESNPEVLFFSRFSTTIVLESRFNVDTILLDLYTDDDIRRYAYFHLGDDGRTLFKGSYYGEGGFFTGLATDELWLVRAECNARLGNITDALDDLNHLRRHRHFSGSFSRQEATGADDALRLVLEERRKELYMRGTRWEDLRRLNKDPRYATSLIREANGNRYELPAGDSRWIWPIPENEIDLSNIQQNGR